MRKGGILNEHLLRVIGSLNHTDMLVVSDAGLPVDKGVGKIDLAVVRNVPGFFQVLEPLLNELVVEKIIIAGEMKEKSPQIYEKLLNLAGNIPVEVIPHIAFKQTVNKSKAVIRTGEFTPYANVILQCGVPF